MKDQRKLMTVIAVIAAVVALALAAAAAAYGSGCSLRIGSLPEPADTVTEYLDCYRNGDFSRMDELTYGYNTIGLSEPEDPFAALLFDTARSELTFNVTENTPEKNMRAVCNVELTCFDAELAKEDIRSTIEHNIVLKINEYNDLGQEFNSDSDEYYDSIILPAVVESASTALEDNQYLVKKQVKLELIYTDSRWQIVLNDELKSALLGGLA